MPGQPDAGAFEQHLARPGSCVRTGIRSTRWRAGSACGGASPSPRCQARSRIPSGSRLAKLCSGDAEERADLLFVLGHHEEVVPDLTAMVADHPLRERMRDC